MTRTTKLSNQQIKEILKEYNLGDFKSKKLVYNAWNISYKVVTTNGTYLVKYLNFHDKELLDRELSILSSLDKNIPLVFPIYSKEGKAHITYNGKYVLIFNFIKAKPVLKGEQLKERALKDLGRYYGLIHKTQITGMPTEGIYDEMVSFFSKLPESSEEYKIAQRTINYLKRRGFDRANLEKGFIHADLHTENLLVNDDKIVAILDFEESRIGPYIFDLGYSILDTCWVGNGLSQHRIKVLLDGYESVRKLTPIEKEYLMDTVLLSGIYIIYFSVRANGINPLKNLGFYVTKRFIKLLNLYAN